MKQRIIFLTVLSTLLCFGLFAATPKHRHKYKYKRHTHALTKSDTAAYRNNLRHTTHEKGLDKFMDTVKRNRK